MSQLRNIIIGVLFFILPLGFCYADPPPQSFQVSVSGTVLGTSVSFSGFSSPNAFITLQEDGNVAGTFLANSDGTFSYTLTAQQTGSHNYGLYVTDGQGRVTPTYGFVLTLYPMTETLVSDILLPTTIDVTTGQGGGAGQNVNLFGSAYENSQVTLFVHSNTFTETTTPGTDGNWSHILATYLNTGSHTAYAMLNMQNGLQSINSSTVNFNVSCGIADLNCDGRVNLTDFSILMYYWGTNNQIADINQDGIVDLSDFSIMMFYWTG